MDRYEGNETDIVIAVLDTELKPKTHKSKPFEHFIEPWQKPDFFTSWFGGNMDLTFVPYPFDVEVEVRDWNFREMEILRRGPIPFSPAQGFLVPPRTTPTRRARKSTKTHPAFGARNPFGFC